MEEHCGLCAHDGDVDSESCASCSGYSEFIFSETAMRGECCCNCKHGHKLLGEDPCRLCYECADFEPMYTEEDIQEALRGAAKERTRHKDIVLTHEEVCDILAGMALADHLSEAREAVNVLLDKCGLDKYDVNDCKELFKAGYLSKDLAKDYEDEV